MLLPSVQEEAVPWLEMFVKHSQCLREAKMEVWVDREERLSRDMVAAIDKLRPVVQRLEIV